MSRSYTYAIADLHGRHDLLLMALDKIAEHADCTSYTLVTLGDYVDRGPESRKIIETLMGLRGAPFKAVCLKGNHEDMMVATLTMPLHPNWWVGNGGGATLVSYGHPRRGDYDPAVVPREHIEWLAGLPLMHVDEHRVFVHAGVDPTLPLDGQKGEAVTWMRYPREVNIGHGDRHVVHGHEQYEDGPILHSNRTDLDTFAWYTGRLVVGVFDDEKPGGPVDLIQVLGAPYSRAEAA